MTALFVVVVVVVFLPLTGFLAWLVFRAGKADQ